MSFNYTKEMVLQEFKDATAKDEKSNKKTYVNRINYLKGLKKFKQETPQYMRDVKISVKQFCQPKSQTKFLQNLLKARPNKNYKTVGCTDSSDGLFQALKDLSIESNCKAIIDYKPN